MMPLNTQPSSQGTPPGSGIARDIITLFMGWMTGIGKSHVQESVTTPGDGVPHQLLENTNYVVPAFTVVNTGTSTAYLGYGGRGRFPLVASSALTFRWMNPVAVRLTYLDVVGAGTTLEVIG